MTLSQAPKTINDSIMDLKHTKVVKIGFEKPVFYHYWNEDVNNSFAALPNNQLALNSLQKNSETRKPLKVTINGGYIPEQKIDNLYNSEFIKQQENDSKKLRSRNKGKFCSSDKQINNEEIINMHNEFNSQKGKGINKCYSNSFNCNETMNTNTSEYNNILKVANKDTKTMFNNVCDRNNLKLHGLNSLMTWQDGNVFENSFLYDENKIHTNNVMQNCKEPNKRLANSYNCKQNPSLISDKNSKILKIKNRRKIKS